VNLPRAVYSGAFIHQQHHHVCLFSANLETDATAFDGHGTRSTPAGAIDVAAGDETLSILGANDEGAFLESGDNHDALSAIEQILRNALVGVPITSCITTAESASRCAISSSPRRVSPPWRASRSIHWQESR